MQPFYISDVRLAKLPTTGPAYDRLVADADKCGNSPIDFSDQDDKDSTYAFANALVARRTADVRRAQKTREVILASIGSQAGSRTLAVNREAGVAYLAADLVELRDPRLAEAGHELLRARLDGRGDNDTVILSHEGDANNWGTHAGFTRLAIDLYCMRYGSLSIRKAARTDFRRAVRVHRGWLGDRDQYVGFDFNQSGWDSWQFDKSKPVGINPKGATKNGHNIDGVLPDDQRRANNGVFSWPPPQENYVWEALQGALASSMLLSNVPHPELGQQVWSWSDFALLRAYTWLHEQCQYPASGDDTWQPFAVNFYHDGAQFPTPTVSTPGKHVGYTCWTHAPR